MNKYASALSLIALVTIAGCTQNETPSVASQTEMSPTATEPVATAPEDAVTATAMGANQLLTATPGNAGCDVGVVTQFHWDAASKPAVTGIELIAGEGADAKLFAAGGPTGDAETGPWVYSGATFILRNTSDQAELDRIVISGPPCPSPTQPAAQ